MALKMLLDNAQRALQLSGSFRLTAEAKERAMRDTGWADGLRGIAAVFVVSSHVVLCYAQGLIPPCCAPNSNKFLLFQLPIFRLVVSGHSWVAVFFVLMGFVNALKPLQLARSGQVDKALQKLAASSFSRVFRLVLPATAATIISWVLCNLGLYSISAQSDAYWLHENTPKPSRSWLLAFDDLFHGLTATWRYGEQNPYDQPQWALIYLLQGSIMIITALSVVASMTTKWRIAVLLLLACLSLNWSHQLGDPYAGFCCFFGVILSELSLSSIPKKVAPYSVYVCAPTALFSLVLMSYPTSYTEAARWSTWFHNFATAYFPADTQSSTERVYGSLGSILLIAAIVVSPHARWVLSRSPFLWLGRVSFAIYLVHGIFLRTVFGWLLQVGQKLRITTENGPDGHAVLAEHYPLPGFFQRMIATVVMAVCVGVASYFWNMKLEPLFAKITSKLEAVATGRTEPSEPKTNGNTILPLRRE